MSKVQQTWLSVVASLLLFPAISLAMPTVSGNTLSWPDDGWYQVQRTDTFETVCEGSLSVNSSVTGGPCVLGSYSYIVINHTSGERFDNITANDVSSSAHGVLVEGARISWPDDGWYQVQNSDTYATVCEGGRGCDVATGNYVVINHTTGERFEDVRVGSAPVSLDNTGTGVMVQGQMLSWPDDGWYQVQNASNFSTVCEGGRGCTVQPGNYVVINHSTGERFNDIEVGTGSSSENSGRPASVMAEGNTIRWPDDGWYQVQNASNFSTVCEGGAECPVSNGSYIVINHTTGERTVLDVGNSTSEEASTTRISFNIMVPAFMSDALQVRLVWGDIDTTAIWNRDELWAASLDFPVNTTNQLVITFSDGNGAITLGSFERSFRTGTSPSESFQIAVDEFDTDRWDSDGDGVSNLSESIAGTNPQGSDALEPVQASLELVQDKTFRISWQQSESAQFYRVFENPDGISGFTDVSGDLDRTTTTFDHRVALFARVNAQYLVQSCNNQGCVDSDVLIVAGTLASVVGYFKASNTEIDDDFGASVSLSADGNTLAVGAAEEDGGATGVNGNDRDNSVDRAGAVYVFIRSNGLWRQQAYLKASSTGNEDFFGISLSLSADGDTLAVSSLDNQRDRLVFNPGDVHIFVRSGEQWQQQAYLKASNSDSGDFFGLSLSLSGDGNTLAVGARGEESAATGINGDQSDNSLRAAGAAYIFVRRGDQWEQQAYIKASNTDSDEILDFLSDEMFGVSVSLSADGNTLAVGASEEDSGTTGINGDQDDDSAQRAGAVYVFFRSGDQWQQEAYVKASNTNLGDLFGTSLSLSGDGNTLAVSATGETSSATGINSDQSNNSIRAAGAVYVFTRSDGLWRQQAYLKASNTERGDGFGGSLSLSADGNKLAVSAIGEDSAATGINGDQTDNSVETAGAVYVFVRNHEEWQQQAYLKSSNTDANDGFRVVSLSADGNTLAVGAIGEDSQARGFDGDQSDNSNNNSGAVYLF